MLDDRYGNQLTTSDHVARDRYVRAVDMLLAGEAGMIPAFEATLARDPQFALGHAGLARASQVSGDMGHARSAIARAAELRSGLTDREASHIDTLALVISGRAANALAAVRAHLQAHPRDAVIAQTSSTIYGLIGFSGLPGREAEMLAFNTALLPHYGDDWWMLSQYAFSLCETGQIARAGAAIDRSMALNNRNAHGAHVHAHVAYECGDRRGGTAFLTDWLARYSPDGIMHGHLSWHAALWSLEAGDIDKMWAIMDSAVAADVSPASPPLGALVDTASLLHRAELAGVEVKHERWTAISNFACRAFPKTGNAFVDVHAALAHAMAGQTEALERIIAGPAGPAADLVPDLARGYREIAAGDWDGAIPSMTRAMADLARIGGSRAQRDLVEHSLLSALMRTGRTEEAQRLVALRRPVLASTTA